MEPNEIEGNVGENKEQQLTVDSSEAGDIMHDKELQRLTEYLNLYSNVWAAVKKEYDRHPLKNDNSDVVLEKNLQILKHNIEIFSSLWAAAKKEYDRHLRDAEPDNTIGQIPGNLNEDDEIQKADEIKRLEPKSIDLWAAANSDYNKVRASSLMAEILEAFRGFPQSDVTDESASAVAPKQRIVQSATVAPEITRDDGIALLQLPEASNICETAYKEIILKAREVGFELSPPVGSPEELTEIIPRPSPRGMRVQCSIETVKIRVKPNELASMMMDVDTWAISLPALIYEASGHDLTADFNQFSASDGNGDGDIAAVKLVTAEVRLPTHLVETRKFCFFRFLRKITKDTWAIFDISQDCFSNNPDDVISKSMCLRRPSGVIIRGQENKSEVIWIENVEVFELPLENVYSTLVNSNIAFSAKHWARTFSHKMHRDINSKIWARIFAYDYLKVTTNVLVHMRYLCDSMKQLFSLSAHEYPAENGFTILFDEGARILKDITGTYVGVASFRIKSKPISVLEYVSNKDMNLKRSNGTKPFKELIQQTTEKPYNCITLYMDSSVCPLEMPERILQEVSRDHFCSYVISGPVSSKDSHLEHQLYMPIEPTGFAIMPDGFGGLHSDASLVTFVVYRRFEGEEAHRAIGTMLDLITTTIAGLGNIF